MADALESRADLLSLTNTLENGSPVAETAGAAANAGAILRVFASLAGHLEEDDVRAFPVAAMRRSSRRTRSGCAP